MSDFYWAKKLGMNKYVVSFLYAIGIVGFILLYLWEPDMGIGMIYIYILIGLLVYIVTLLGYDKEDKPDEEKVEKGFELYYFSLSARRKFIRELWMIPLMLVVAIIPWIATSYTLWRKIAIVIVIICMKIFSLSSTYMQWKEKQKED